MTHSKHTISIRRPGVLAWLIIANVAVFILTAIVWLCSRYNLAEALALYTFPYGLAHNPWGIATYMFVQTDFIHLLFNMLWLWAFGILLQRLCSPRTLLIAYPVCGLGAALAFILASAICGQDATRHVLLGSSGAVIGIAATIGTVHPKIPVNLVLFGEVQLRWIVLVSIAITIAATAESGWVPTAAHIGGAIAGILMGCYVNHTYTRPRKIRFKSPKTKNGKASYPSWHPRQVRQHERRGLNVDEQAEFDQLLERVRISGFKNLSNNEKRRLFELSEHIKK